MTTRSEIERLFHAMRVASNYDAERCADALMSSIDRVLAERDARIEALEKALTDIRDEADVYELELTETNVRMRLRAIFNTSRNALRALAQPE